MLKKGPARKVTIYVNEDTQHNLAPLHEALLEYLLHKGIAGATLTRATAGFGAHHTVHTVKSEMLMEHLPMVIQFVECQEVVDLVLPTLYDMVSDGMIEIHDTVIVKAVSKDRPPAEKVRHEKRRGPEKLMRVYMGESDRWDGEPLYEAILKRLRMIDIAGATVYKGILGYGAKGEPHKEHFLHISEDLPVILTVVETADKIGKAVEIIEGMMSDGVIVTSDVEVTRFVHTIDEGSR